jgi:tetratricopeptide (TPR) repeat protein
LLSMARQRALEFQLKGLEVEAGKENPSRQAEEEIRIARREIAEGKYEEARSRLHEAVTLSSVYLNGRTAAQGRLEQARCETLLDDRTRAKELYREIMADPEASPAVGAMATFELITLLSFERATARVAEVIEENGELLRVGPFRRGVDCLTGDLDAATFEGEILEIPEGFQNDAFFVLGVHYAAIGKPAKARGYFKECLRGSNPPGDWPAPLAKEYLKRKRL